MVLLINKIPEGRSVLCQNIEIEEGRAALIPPIKNLSCKAEIDRIQDRISVHLYYQGTMTLECSRCLKEFVFPLDGSFYLTLKNTSGPKKHPEEEESEFSYNDSTEELDIQSAIVDDIVVSIPMKPLCSEGCPGIAFNSNGVTKKPESNKEDPRWNGLKKINLKDFSNISKKKNTN
jgi:uncharacterized metal-binding protein YceD (DUF177 family)